MFIQSGVCHCKITSVTSYCVATYGTQQHATHLEPQQQRQSGHVVYSKPMIRGIMKQSIQAVKYTCSMELPHHDASVASGGTGSL